MRPLIVACLLLAGCMGGLQPVDFRDVDAEHIRANDVPGDMAYCDHPGAFCCNNTRCAGAGLVCGFTEGVRYGKCEACGRAPVPSTCPSDRPLPLDGGLPIFNFVDCGQPCCDNNACDEGECMTGRGITHCIDEKACGHDGQPCCYGATFCVVGLRCVLDVNRGEYACQR